MSNLTSMLKRCIIALILVGCSMYGNAQVSPTVSQNGFSLQKSVSLSAPRSGDIFSYTITFSIPAGAVDVFVYDQIPAPLVIDGIITPPNYSGFVPTVTNTAGLVTLYFPSVTSSISGSFQVNVHFPVDSACNGKRVGNFAELTAKLPPNTKIKTEPVYSTCVVDNPWRIWKSTVGLPYVGGACPYGTYSDTVEYFVQIAKQSWVLSGSASWYNIAVTDVLSPGATVLPTTYSSSANMSPSSISAGGIITLPAGFKLDANANNYYWARFKVKHAPIAMGVCDSNTVRLNGRDACNNTFSDVSTVKVKKIPVPIPAPNVVLAKWVTVNGNVPGCTGTYFIRVCNTGGAASTPYTLTDNFPACLTGITPNAAPSGATISGGPYNYTMNGPSLLPGQCQIFSFNFTIGTGCVSSVTNTVTATVGFSGSASTTFYLLPPAPTACLTKTICSPAPNAYAVGTQVRFRLRVQNIGGTPITGADIKDQLDNSSLEYVGNELYYSYPNPFAPCAPNNTTPPSGATAWPGVGTSHNTSTGALQWNLPSIDVECGNVAYPACGFAYGLRAYYIEFTVKIKDTAGIGNIRNCATIANGTLTPTSVSSCATFVTNGVLNYTVNKEVSKDNGATFSSAVTVSPGAIVDYKLSGVNSGIGLINPVLVDLLPMDNSTSDNFILSCLSRGSNFDVRYNSFVSSTHTYSGQFFSSSAGTNTFPELGVNVSCMPNAAGWVTSPSVGAANLKTPLTQPFGSSPLAYIFKAKTDPNAKEGDVACNSYALRGSAKYLINYTANYLLQTALESGKACVTLEKPGCCDPIGFDIPKEVCVNYNTLFCVKDTCNPANVYYWDFGDGSPVVTGTCINYAYTTPGGYIITIKWRNECGEYYKQFEVKVKECPCDVKVSFTVNTNGLTIVADGTATTSSLPAVMYVWSYGDGTYGTGPVSSHTYASPGNYTVRLVVYALDAKGNICECKGECKTDIYVDKDKVSHFGCNEADGGTKKEDVVLKASPNPFRNNVTVSFEIVNKLKAANQTGYTLEFMNLNGIVLQRQKLANLQSVVSLESAAYPAGVYFVVLKNAKGDVQTTRVIKL